MTRISAASGMQFDSVWKRALLHKGWESSERHNPVHLCLCGGHSGGRGTGTVPLVREVATNRWGTGDVTAVLASQPVVNLHYFLNELELISSHPSLQTSFMGSSAHPVTRASGGRSGEQNSGRTRPSFLVSEVKLKEFLLWQWSAELS